MSFSLQLENLSKVELSDDMLICLINHISTQDNISSGAKKVDIIIKDISVLKRKFLPTLGKLS